MAEEIWTLDRIPNVTGVIVVVDGGIWWASALDTRLANLEKRFDKEQERSADALCLAVVQRQIAVIEKNRPDVSVQLSTLATNHGCDVSGEQVAAATVAVDPAQDERERSELAQKLADIEELLDNPD